MRFVVAQVSLSSIAKVRPVRAAMRSPMSASLLIRLTAIRSPNSRRRRSAASANLTDRNAGRSKMLMPRKWRSSRITAAAHRHRAPRPSPDWRRAEWRPQDAMIVQNLEIAAGTEMDEVEAELPAPLKDSEAIEIFLRALRARSRAGSDGR